MRQRPQRSDKSKEENELYMHTGKCEKMQEISLWIAEVWVVLELKIKVW